MNDIWSPLTLNCGKSLRNRMLLAPMTTDASNADGTVAEDELDYLQRRCDTGFGAALTACTYVEDDGRSWQGIGAARDEQIPSLRRVADAMRQAGGLAILQIYDGGRIARPSLIGEDRMRAPSAIPSLRPGALTPREMTDGEVEHLVASFRDAARRAREAGFDGVEIHGANHYLVHQFFSPRGNQRQDRWGGDLERRMQFPLAVARAAREGAGPDLVVGFRITPFEGEADGYGLTDAVALCDRLASEKLDYLHVSLDNFRSGVPIREDRNWSKPAAPVAGVTPNAVASIAAVVNGRCAVVACGGIKTRADAVEAMEAGADLVAVGRAALVDPHWLQKVRTGNEQAIAPRMPASADRIADELTIPPRMVEYLLGRPGWIPREGAPS